MAHWTEATSPPTGFLLFMELRAESPPAPPPTGRYAWYSFLSSVKSVALGIFTSSSMMLSMPICFSSIKSSTSFDTIHDKPEHVSTHISTCCKYTMVSLSLHTHLIVNEDEIVERNTLVAVELFLRLEDVSVEELLQLLVGVIDTQLSNIHTTDKDYHT